VRVDLIIPLSDLHVGSKYALWPPGISKDDSQHGENAREDYRQNVIGKIFWQHWRLFLHRIEKIQPRAFIFNGDCIDGIQDREGGHGLYTRSIDLQCDVAERLIQMIRKACPDAAFYFTAGTEYHEKGKNHDDAEEDLAKRFDAEFGNELVIEEAGCHFFARHVIPPTIGLFQYMATAPGREHLMLYINRGPEKYGEIDTAIFSHRHQFVAVQFSSGFAMVTPGWQAKTGYAARRRGILGVPDMGWVELVVRDGKVKYIETDGMRTLVRPCRRVGRDLHGRKIT
jgi:hypothetical protein